MKGLCTLEIAYIKYLALSLLYVCLAGNRRVEKAEILSSISKMLLVFSVLDSYHNSHHHLRLFPPRLHITASSSLPYNH